MYHDNINYNDKIDEKKFPMFFSWAYMRENSMKQEKK